MPLLLLLLPQQETHVEAEASQEPDVQQHDHQKVPATSPPEKKTEFDFH